MSCECIPTHYGPQEQRVLSSAAAIFCTFNDANGTSLDAYSWANVDDRRPGAAQWIETLGDWDIQSGRANVSALGGGIKAAVTLDCGVADCVVSGQLTPAALGGPGVVLRYIDDTHAWLISLSTVSRDAILWENSGGGWVARCTLSYLGITAGVTYTVAIQMLDEVIRFRVDDYESSYGYAAYSKTTMTHGLRGYVVGDRYDDFKVDNPMLYTSPEEPDPILPPTITAVDQVAVDALRAAIITELWEGAGLPVAGADVVTVGVADPLLTSAANLLRVDQLTITMDDNLGAPVMDSEPYVWYPTVATSNGLLMMYGVGHTADWELAGGGDMIRALIEAGYTVCGFLMPANGSAAVHNTYTDLPGLNYTKFFIEPTVRAINELAAGFAGVYMCGLSGGGWTTVMSTAIDTRISRSVEISGSYPLYIMGISRDWEQYLNGFPVMDYQDLYIMACDAGRRQLQLHGEFDGVFPRNRYTQWERYAPTVRDTVAGIGGTGPWSMEWDSTYFDHLISEYGRNRTLDYFAAA